MTLPSQPIWSLIPAPTNDQLQSLLEDAFEGAMAKLDELRTDFTAGEAVARGADFPKAMA